jgi:hypothetical protein
VLLSPERADRARANGISTGKSSSPSGRIGSVMEKGGWAMTRGRAPWFGLGPWRRTQVSRRTRPARVGRPLTALWPRCSSSGTTRCQYQAAPPAPGTNTNLLMPTPYLHNVGVFV